MVNSEDCLIDFKLRLAEQYDAKASRSMPRDPVRTKGSRSAVVRE